MGNTQIRETQVVGDALDGIAALLPASWRLDRRFGESGDGRLDAVVELVGQEAVKASFVVVAKRSGSVPASLLILELRELEQATDRPALFASDYIGPALRDALAAEEFSFADARSPRSRPTSAVTRLNGLAASRTIRALTSAALPVGVRGLAGLADVSPGSVSKLLVTLATEGIVDRDQNGGIVAVRRRALLRRWAVDYSFAQTNPSVGYFIAPRGLERALVRLVDQRNVAVTGSAAARRLLPVSSTSVVPLRLLAIYAVRPAELANELGLIDADRATANVVIARPQDPDILNSSDRADLVTSPIPLVIVDLLSLPGRSDAEAEQLMDALATTDEAWKG